MSERASYFKLGLVVIIGTALLLTGVALLGAGAFFKRTFTAETYMEESVQGLDVGAPVKHRGVQVGKVSRIAFLGDEYELPPGPDSTMNMQASFVYVEMELDLNRRTPERTYELFKSAIRGGMHARLASSGLVGTVYVDLFFAKDEAPPFELGWEPVSLYIPSSKSIIAQLTETASRIAKQLEEAKFDRIAVDLDRVINNFDSKINQADIPGLQANIAGFIDELRESNRRVQEMLSNPSIDATIKSVAKAAESVERLAGESEGSLGAFIKDLPEISARLKSSSEQIDSILHDEKTTKLIADLSKAAEVAPGAAAEVRRVAQRLGALLSSQQSDLEAIVQQLRKTMDNAERLSAEAAQNPSRVIFGEPPPKDGKDGKEGHR